MFPFHEPANAKATLQPTGKGHTMTKSSTVSHTDAFTGVSFAIAISSPPVGGSASNDVDETGFQRPTARGLADMLATFDVVTPDNIKAYMALACV